MHRKIGVQVMQLAERHLGGEAVEVGLLITLAADTGVRDPR